MRKPTSNLLTKSIQIISIAFNNPSLLNWQISHFNKNLTDPFSLVILDNSTTGSNQKKNEIICRQMKTRYVKLPPLKNIANGSISHGTALNWGYEHLVLPDKSEYFGFVDHDVVPWRKTSLISKLKLSPIYGHLQTREDKWYLWPGLCFYKKKSIKNNKINFLPVSGLDTGGGNWDTLYKYFNKPAFVPPKHVYLEVKHKNKLIKIDSEDRKTIEFLLSKNCLIELMGDWLHLFNGSNWRHVQN